MQISKCKVMLSGSRNNEVLKSNVTPAEIIVLKAIHGNTSINDIVITGTIKTNAVAEKDRLAARYNGPVKKVVEELFPGAVPNMPETFDEANINYEVAPSSPQPKGNITTMKGNQADVVTDEEKENIKNDKSVVVKQADEEKVISDVPSGAETAVDAEIETDNSIEEEEEAEVEV